jgi:hypothetical protein
VLADKADDADRMRELIKEQGSIPNNPAQEQLALELLLQQKALARAQSDRAGLLQAEAASPHAMTSSPPIFSPWVQLGLLRLWLRACEPMTQA